MSENEKPGLSREELQAVSEQMGALLSPLSRSDCLTVLFVHLAAFSESDPRDTPPVLAKLFIEGCIETAGGKTANSKLLYTATVTRLDGETREFRHEV
jgi:hypothetical protein